MRGVQDTHCRCLVVPELLQSADFASVPRFVQRPHQLKQGEQVLARTPLQERNDQWGVHRTGLPQNENTAQYRHDDREQASRWGGGGVSCTRPSSLHLARPYPSQTYNTKNVHSSNLAFARTGSHGHSGTLGGKDESQSRADSRTKDASDDTASASTRMVWAISVPESLHVSTRCTAKGSLMSIATHKMSQPVRTGASRCLKNHRKYDGRGRRNEGIPHRVCANPTAESSACITRTYAAYVNVA